ncbi:MAG: hypothetical protein WC916_04630 [Candidatus Woesearchaeota archaeon]
MQTILLLKQLDEKAVFTIQDIKRITHCNSLYAKQIINRLHKKGFIKKIDKKGSIWVSELSPLIDTVPKFSEVKNKILKNISG